MPPELKFKRLSFVLAIIVSLTGFLVLIGWAGNITLLKSISPHWLSLKPNAAICFLLSGATVIIVNRQVKSVIVERITTAFAFIIFVTGTITLLQYIFQFNAGIDQLFFRDHENLPPGILPGRQSPFSAAYFVLFGFCYLPVVYKKMNPSLFQLLHFTSGIFVLASVISYVLGSYVIAGVSLGFIFVIHSTISFFLVILAVLFSQPEKGYMKLICSDTTGGRMIRRIFPPFVLLFIFLRWLLLEGERAGLYNTAFGLSIFIISMIIFLGYFLYSSAVSITKSEKILKQSEEKINAYNEQLRTLNSHLLDVREEERARIGREIHDELGQQLTALKMETARLTDKNRAAEEYTGELKKIIDHIDYCISMVRRISYDLKPGILDDLGIIAALEVQAAEFEKSTKIKATFFSNVEELDLHPDQAINLFRIYQESLTNVTRHSGARSVNSTLNTDENSVVLTIKDDGRGFDTATFADKKTMGLLGIRERTLLMKGHCEIKSAPGAGTEIRVTIFFT